MAGKNRFQDKFSAGKVGTGRFYTAGSLTSRKRRGLAGALRKTKVAGKHSYAKNLSKKDLKTFQKIIGKEMSQLSTHSKGLGRKARMRIMGEGERLRRGGKLSAADKHDLRKIVKALGTARASQKQAPAAKPTPKTPTKRAAKFATDTKSAPTTKTSRVVKTTPKTILAAKKQKHIKADISLDITEEAIATDKGKNSIQHDPRSVLGQSEQNQTKTSDKTTSVRRRKKLPNKKDVIAKRGNMSNKSDDKIIELDIG